MPLDEEIVKSIWIERFNGLKPALHARPFQDMVIMSGELEWTWYTG